MAYKISTTHQFEKDLKRCIRRGYPMDEFRTVIQLLERDGRLPEVYRPTCSTATDKANGSVISSPTGC
jgi:mRNA interferase YafQ